MLSRRSRFTKAAWGCLAFNLVTILWGAYVRASGSGAGCGSHWPLCNGQVLPWSARVQTLVEFTHRASSGICLILSLGLALWARRAFPRGHRARSAAGAQLGFMLAEAMIGAALVLFGFVDHDRSGGRAFSISLHLVNTLFLLASIALTARWSEGDSSAPAIAAPTRVVGLTLAAFLATIGLGVSGALTALGDTLFHSASLATGMRADFQVGSHFLLKLRVVHPALAVATAALLLILAGVAQRTYVAHEVQRRARALHALVYLQLALGATNLLLLAPVPMQLLHLLVADLLWLSLVLLAAAIREALPVSTHPAVVYARD